MDSAKSKAGAREEEAHSASTVWAPVEAGEAPSWASRPRCPPRRALAPARSGLSGVEQGVRSHHHRGSAPVEVQASAIRQIRPQLPPWPAQLAAPIFWI